MKLPLSIKEAAARLAKADGVSLNQWIASAVAQRLEPWRQRPIFYVDGLVMHQAMISLKCSIASASNRRNPATSFRLTSTDQGRFFCQSLAVNL
ncbi:hypothetical protein ACWTU6_21785 [Mesorhizobium sp. BHbsci]